MSDYRSGTSHNYDLQELFLGRLQSELSQGFFLHGVSSAIVKAAVSVGGNISVNTEGVAFLDNQYVPCLHKTEFEGEQVDQLNLAAALPKPEKGYPSYKFFPLGIVREADVLVQYTGVPEDEALAVMEGAAKVLAAQEEGLLPDLQSTLLGINRGDRNMIAHRRLPKL